MNPNRDKLIQWNSRFPFRTSRGSKVYIEIPHLRPLRRDLEALLKHRRWYHALACREASVRDPPEVSEQRIHVSHQELAMFSFLLEFVRSNRCILGCPGRGGCSDSATVVDCSRGPFSPNKFSLSQVWFSLSLNNIFFNAPHIPRRST